MSFKGKLARLGGPPQDSRDAVPGDRAATLEALRGEMAAILRREQKPPRPPADPGLSELPFLRHDTDHGELCQRLEALAPSHHVGRMPVDSGRGASAEILALLALDPALSECDMDGALFLDTETTGLGGGTGTIAFLVGLAAFDHESFRIEQLLLRVPHEEPAMLRRIAERVEAASLLVTFNGKAFDLPLIQTRFVMNKMPKLPDRPHLDLVHVARRLHKARIGRCTLKSVEANVLGFDRDGDIDGGEVAPRYSHFLRTGDEEALRAVVEHNAWDVVSMGALVGLYGEPLGALDDEDLVGLSKTFKRAKAFDRAHEAADAAVTRGAGAAALRARAEVSKARGDKARALEDYEAFALEVDDASVRLELAKLYEHFVKAPATALEMVEAGTGESDEALVRRRARLERKVARRQRG